MSTRPPVNYESVLWLEKVGAWTAPDGRVVSAEQALARARVLGLDEWGGLGTLQAEKIGAMHCFNHPHWPSRDDIEDQAVLDERQKIYGDPRAGHRFIAMSWAGLLQPRAESIGKGEVLPEHVVALMMAAVKLHRCHLVFHEDNYVDARNYLRFAERWQGEGGES